MKQPYQLLFWGICMLFLNCFAQITLGQRSAKEEIYLLDRLYESNYKKGDLVAAEFNLLEQIELLKKESGSDNIHTFEATLKLAGFYQETGQLEDADRIYNRLMDFALKVYEEKDPKFMGFLYNSAVVCNDLGEYGAALDLYNYMKDICLEYLGKDNTTYAYALEGLATTYYNLERYEEAESCYQEVLTIQKTLSGTENAKYAFALSNLASVYQAKDKNLEAIKLIKQALFIQEKVLGKNNDEYANSLNTLAVLYTKLKYYEAAESTIKEGLTVLEKKIGNEHPWYLSAQANLVALWIRVGAYVKAEKLCLRLKEKQRRLLGKKHPTYIHTLGLTAKIYLNKGALDAALKYIMEALSATFSEGQPKMDYSEAFIQKIPTISYDYQQKINYIYEILLTVLKEYYKKTKEVKWLKQRHQIIKQVILLNETFRNEFTFETDKYNILNTVAFFINKGMESCLELLMLTKDKMYEEDAFIFAEQNKSVLLLDALRSRKNYQFGNLPDSLAKKERILQKEKGLLQKNLLEMNSPEETRSKLNDLNNKISQFKAMLKQEYPQYFETKYGGTIVESTTQEIQAMVDEETAILEYFVADSMTYLFALTRKELNVIPINITKKELKRKVNAFHGILSQYDWILKDSIAAWAHYTQAANWFYQKMVAPAEIKANRGIKKLIIIPDYELGHLPFEAFLVEEPREKVAYKKLHYLLNDYQISYNYSTILWQSNLNQERMVANGEVLGLASSYKEIEKELLLNKRGHALTKLRMGLTSLAAVEDEVAGISKIYAGQFLTKDDASEAMFKKNAPNYDIIHMAMHGILNQETPVLSSLVFSENLEGEEDNFLHAYEISQLHLNAQLVVLSACETGIGKFEQGEGVLSLARSFMYAGVPSLVVSLWQVHDFSTSLLMQAFYGNLTQGMNKAEALRQAKQIYIKHAAGVTGHPAFWSAFIQIGDSRPVQMNSRYGWIKWEIGVLLLLVGGVVWQKRQA